MTTQETVLGEFQSDRKARASREAIAGLLKARYDLATDTYVLTVDGSEASLRVKDYGRNDIRVILESPIATTKEK